MRISTCAYFAPVPFVPAEGSPTRRPPAAEPVPDEPPPAVHPCRSRRAFEGLNLRLQLRDLRLQALQRRALA